MALSVTMLAAALDLDRHGSPALTLTMRCMSAKLSIFSPSMARTRSPGLKPAAAAALSGCTASTRALVVCLPTTMKMPAKITMARMKFAIGPGRHHGGARADRLMDEAVFLFGLAHGGGGRLVGHAGRIVVAEKFHIAAERHRGDLPAGAIAVVEAGDLRAEADREGEHAMPHQRATRKWPSS